MDGSDNGDVQNVAAPPGTGLGNIGLGNQIETEYLWKNSLLQKVVSNIGLFAINFWIKLNFIVG